MIRIRVMLWFVVCMAFAIESTAKEASDIPVTKVATNITDAGFTANWESVENAIGYDIYTILTHTASADGKHYLINDPFDLVDRGTEEEPYPGDSDFEYLDNYMHRGGWSMIWPSYATGQLGFDNLFGEYEPAELRSPLYDLSHDNGEVLLELTAKAVGDEADIDKAEYIVVLLCDKEDRTLDSIALKLSPEWTEMRFDLHGGLKECCLKVTVIGFGTMYIDNLRLSQHLQKGESVDMLYASALTDETSFDVLTPDKMEGDSYSYKVAACMDGGVNGFWWSDYSEPERVIAPTGVMPTKEIDEVKVYMAEDLHIVLAEAASVNIYSESGICIYSQFKGVGEHTIILPNPGLYCIVIDSQIFKVMR